MPAPWVGLPGYELFKPEIELYAAQYGLPPGLLEALFYRESKYDLDVIRGYKRGVGGAMGIAQFIPATARWLGIDPTRPAYAIAAAAWYLSNLIARQGGRQELGVASYNWGEGNIRKWLRGQQKLRPLTKNYVAEVSGVVLPDVVA